MMQRALHLPHRNIGLFYSARTPDEFAFEQELRGLADGRRDRAAADGDARDRTDWTGARGRLNRDALGELVHDPGDAVFRLRPAGAGRRDARRS